MKFPLLLMLLPGICAVSCQPEPLEESTKPTLSLTLTAQSAAGSLPDQKNSAASSEWIMETETWKLYLSEIRLRKTDGSLTLVEDVWLADLMRADTSVAGDLLTRTLNSGFEPGAYDALVIKLGLPDYINQTDATQYPASSPLSVTHGMYWDWASGYRFVVWEGNWRHTDSLQSRPFVFHLGTNALVREIIIPFSQVLEATEKTTYAYNLKLDTDSFLVTPTGDFPISQHPTIHTMGTEALARQLMNQFSGRFSINPR